MNTITKTYIAWKEHKKHENDNEQESIKRYSQGEALFVCGNRRVRMNVMVTPEDLESFGEGGGV